MLKAPRGACMSSPEYEKFLQKLTEAGFPFDPSRVPPHLEREYGEAVDRTEDALENYLYYEGIYSKVMDLKNNFRDEPVMYRGQEINYLNYNSYIQHISEEAEKYFTLLYDGYEEMLSMK